MQNQQIIKLFIDLACPVFPVFLLPNTEDNCRPVCTEFISGQAVSGDLWRKQLPDLSALFFQGSGICLLFAMIPAMEKAFIFHGNARD